MYVEKLSKDALRAWLVENPDRVFYDGRTCTKCVIAKFLNTWVGTGEVAPIQDEYGNPDLQKSEILPSSWSDLIHAFDTQASILIKENDEKFVSAKDMLAVLDNFTRNLDSGSLT